MNAVEYHNEHGYVVIEPIGEYKSIIHFNPDYLTAKDKYPLEIVNDAVKISNEDLYIEQGQDPQSVYIIHLDHNTRKMTACKILRLRSKTNTITREIIFRNKVEPEQTNLN